MKEPLKRFRAAAAISGIWPFLRPEGGLLVYAAAVTLLLTAAEVAAPVLLGISLDSLIGGTSSRGPGVFTTLGRDGLVAALLADALLAGLLLAHQSTLSGKIGQRVTARMRDALWVHLQRLPIEYTRERGPGRLMMRFLSDARSVQRLVSEGVVRISQDALLTVAMVTVLVAINWRMGLVVAFSLPVYVFVFRSLNSRIQRHSRDTRFRRTKLSGYLNTRISSMEVVKTYGRHRAETKRVAKLNDRIVREGTRLEAAGGWLEGASATVIATTGALVLWLAAAEISAGRLTGGQLVTFFALLGLMSSVFRRITVANRYLQEAQISIERLTDTLAREPETPVDETLPKLEVDQGEVCFHDVSFAYPDGTRVLEHANLVARRGELVAITGPDGSGKSTLLKLLLRFLSPAAGCIFIDGQDTHQASTHSLRLQIGFVSQDPKVFEGTISDNVSYGVRSNRPKEPVEYAVRLAGVDRIVETLPDGWQTRLRDGRRELSHVERFRVAFARALAVDPPIVVLDEPASAMAPATEQELAQTLRELAREKTVIVATHSLPTLLAADRIYHLEHGRLIEEYVSTLLVRDQEG